VAHLQTHRQPGSRDPTRTHTHGPERSALGRRVRRLDSTGFHQQVARHLEVEGRAELGAVEREGARSVSLEGDVDVLAGLEAAVHVVRANGEAMGRVVGLLHVGDVQMNGVAQFHSDDGCRPVSLG